jgi:hypothetical protein
MTGVIPALFLGALAWGIVISGKRWWTILWFVVSFAATLGAFVIAGAIWPDLAGVLGHAALIPTLVISGFVGLTHARANRAPSPPEAPKVL